jgi:ferredoxin
MHRDIAMTLQGRAIALSSGAPLTDLAASADACVLCGACEPVCPEEIDTVGMTLDLRLALNQTLNQTLPHSRNQTPDQSADRAGDSPLITRAQALIEAWNPSSTDTNEGSGAQSSAKMSFLPGPGFDDRPQLLKMIASILGAPGRIGIARDDGRDLSWAREAGIALSPERVDAFLGKLRGRRELVFADGILLREFKLWRPKITAVSLGKALLLQPAVRSRLRSTDLLIIESRAFHTGGRRSAQFYARLRDETGCETNLDLQRTAMATGWAALNGPAAAGSALDRDEQIRWIMRQSKAQRIVVESIAEYDAFASSPATADAEVVHLAQIADRSQ